MSDKVKSFVEPLCTCTKRYADLTEWICAAPATRLWRGEWVCAKCYLRIVNLLRGIKHPPPGQQQTWEEAIETSGLTEDQKAALRKF